MNIHTDLIENKRFISAIESSLQKHSQEYRVLATLRYLFPAQFESMNIGEAPDLQDQKNSVGIEVTVAVNNDDMNASRAFSKLCKSDPAKVDKLKEKIKKSGYLIVSVKDTGLAINSSGVSDGEKFFFQESIRKKAKKISQYKTKFTTVGLAILLSEIPTAYAESHLFEWIFELVESNEIQVDFIYVISHRFCVFYDIIEKSFKKIMITKDENRLLSTIGRMTAEGELTLENEEWM